MILKKHAAFAALAGLALTTGSANGAVLLSTDFSGTTVSGQSLTGITYSVSNGLSGPSSIGGVNNLFSTADATGYYVPSVQVNNGTWNVNIPVTVASGSLVVNSVLLERRHFNVSGDFNADGNKHYPITVSLIGSTSGEVGSVTLGDNTTVWGSASSIEEFDFGSITINSSETWTFNVLVNGTSGPTNNGVFVGMGSFEIQGIPEPSTALLGGLGMLCLLRRRR